MTSSFPRAANRVVETSVGHEIVLLDGWSEALALNPTAAHIWMAIDGSSTADEIALDLAEAYGVDAELALEQVESMIRRLTTDGFLEGGPVEVPESEDDIDPGITLEAIVPLEVGDSIDHVLLDEVDGPSRSVLSTDGRETFLVNWNPHCGYCARIAHDLVDLHQGLADAEIDVVLVATGGPDANRTLAQSVGLTAPILLAHDDVDLFRSAGTPAAYHLDATGKVISNPAYGCDEVPILASKLAGVEGRDDESTSAVAGSRSSSPEVRYLLDRGGACAPMIGTEPAPTWEGVRAYRVADHHVGIRYSSSATAEVLDRLFLGHRVDDPRAGHSFSVSLDRPAEQASQNHAPGRRAPARELNLLVQATQPTVRSRSPARILRALLGYISDGVTEFDKESGRFQVNAMAVLHAGGAALLPANFHGFAPRLQALLARHGIALADVPHPEIDLQTAELVIPEVAVDHDTEVLAEVAAELTGGAELPPVLPGRYPLTTWCVIHPSDRTVTTFSPAEAAAATLSFVQHTDDAPSRVRKLGDLFTRIPAHGLWYHSESGVIQAITQALDTSAVEHR